jgi:hypothetical protein
VLKENDLFRYAIMGNNAVAIIGLISESSDAHLLIPDTIDSAMVTLIAKAAFMDNDQIQSVSIPDTLLKIGGQAFADCDSLTELVIPTV